MVYSTAERVDTLTTENIVGVEAATRGFFDRCRRIFSKVRLNGVQSSPDPCRFLLRTSAFAQKKAWSSGDCWSPLASGEWTTDGLKILMPDLLIVDKTPGNCVKPGPRSQTE